MKVLLVHNAYQFRGGEDAVVDAERSLLLRHGHQVIDYLRHNNELVAANRFKAATDTLWSARTWAEIDALLAAERPDVMHAHNTFPQISPSLYWAASERSVPVVQTLHNFRLLCPQAMLLRKGRVCESCVGRTPLRGVLHGCYRGSRLATGILASSLMLHRAAGTWANKVDRYIALNEFCRAKFVEGGLPAERIKVKPNFVELAAPAAAARRGLLFVGRLSEEKGIGVLADAARSIDADAIRVVGVGPAASQLTGVLALVQVGELESEEVAAEMARAVALVMPSICYENFPRTLVEAFACGLPVVASRLGALAELVEDGVTGLHFEAGNAADFASKMQWALANPGYMAEMGRTARRVYERLYTPEINYEQLMAIYREAIALRAT